MAHVADLVAAIEARFASAAPGEQLLDSPITLSVFESLSDHWERRGLAFTPIIGPGDGADPLGLVSRDPSYDPSQPHEAAVRALTATLLAMLGNSFTPFGSTTLPFGSGRRKAPDMALGYLPPGQLDIHLVVVAEVAHMIQPEASLLHNILLWATPVAAGGGGARLALGVKLAYGGSPAAELTAHLRIMSTSGGGPLAPQRAPPVVVTPRSLRGDPATLVWLPLSHLMPGSSRAQRMWVAMWVAAGGVAQGLRQLLPLPSWRAAAWALARWRSPWGAVPLDLGDVRRAYALPSLRRA
ncbi:hypothetical protein HYH03_012865 [Edaphochlamys debaryana]|uniref:Uncharacterized protein n=1 Tax=Edaphochlamys debaryana TaxID=47281 RepID=A0A836BTH4_9CHLO|nr:hypothetical protein HYH03_012865 [Edaphochlamys debaryana]|eukprot:KAG2488546.1 hypothetical protein HYH03_012865 [Edaphochlamys debaryana]